MLDHGVSASASRTFVSAFYSSMASNTEVPGAPSLADMAIEAATPGGLNEQGLDYLKMETSHFQNQTKSLEEVYDRLIGKTTYVKRK